MIKADGQTGKAFIFVNQKITEEAVNEILLENSVMLTNFNRGIFRRRGNELFCYMRWKRL